MTLALLVVSGARAPCRADGLLRVCADPNHLPYSNDAGDGFENEIAALLAETLGRELQMTWWPARRGFLRSTLNAGRCDLVVGVPATMDAVATTEPYYRSCYVFVHRPASTPLSGELSDPALRALRIGVHLVGDDYQNSPPAHALTAHGLVERVVGYSAYGDYGEASPLRQPVDAVAKGEIDTALLWGPIAGYFAKEQGLLVTPARVAATAAHPFAYDIAIGTRRDDTALRDEIGRALLAQRTAIGAILTRFGVPSCADTGSKALSKVNAEGAGDATENPFRGDKEAAAEGAKLYRKLNCYACHGAAGGGGMGPNLTDETWMNGEGSDADLLLQILDGKGAMPPYRAIVEEDDAWKLITFVRTLYRGDPGKAHP